MKIIFLIIAAAFTAMGGGKTMDTAIFAGGCFWCMEEPFDSLPGVVSADAGYTGGTKADPTYEEVSTGTTGHREAIRVTYDPAKTTYQKLLDRFWRQIDPTDPDGQFADRGSQYRAAIFYSSAEQKKLAEESKAALARSGKFKKPIVTEILPAAAFYKAETYHQKYYCTNPLRYHLYKEGSGRVAFIKKNWNDQPAFDINLSGPKPSKNDLKKKLNPLQYQVTQECGTEPPFKNEYWNNHREGIYVDVVSGEPLFSSTDKFESNTGWPSFVRPLVPANVVEQQDSSLGMVRTEVRSRQGDSHLGHLFDDGPLPTGQRYCINSASLRFIPKEDLEKNGYGQYRDLFTKKK